MANISDLLTLSRNAHKAGRDLAGKKQFTDARAKFQVALDARLKARAADPGHADPAWAGDLQSIRTRKELDRDLGRTLHVAKGEAEPAGYDQPSQRGRDQLTTIDAELEAYFRQQLGEDRNTHSQVDLKDAAAMVRTPDRWQTKKEGVTACATCTHPKDSHIFVDGGGRCGLHVFKEGRAQLCECLDYVPMPCAHKWQTVAELDGHPGYRDCVGCGERQVLTPTIPLEQTEAYKQLARESQRKQ